MPSYDSHVPPVLCEIQKWFGEVIGTAINASSQMSLNQVSAKAADYIVPSKGLTPFQRTELYNQQYWWRLLSALQDNFPMLTRLFGPADFNESIGKRALTKYPPTHWSLSRLGEEVVHWIDEEYHHADRSLVLDSAKIDWYTTDSLTVKELPPLTLSKVSPELASKRLALQPHLHLLQLNANLFTLREELLTKDPDGWVGTPFPSIDKSGTHHYAIFRTPNLAVTWKSLHPKEYKILSALQAGSSLEEATDLLEESEASLLAGWCQEWAMRKWLSETL
jgi:hypothetical protein